MLPQFNVLVFPLWFRYALFIDYQPLHSKFHSDNAESLPHIHVITIQVEIATSRLLTYSSSWFMIKWYTPGHIQKLMKVLFLWKNLTLPRWVLGHYAIRSSYVGKGSFWSYCISVLFLTHLTTHTKWHYSRILGWPSAVICWHNWSAAYFR